MNWTDRLNLEYRATENPYQRHRAMQILRPSTELAGRYTCKVSTFNNEESVSSVMVVYGKLFSFSVLASARLRPQATRFVKKWLNIWINQWINKSTRLWRFMAAFIFPNERDSKWR